MFAYEPIEVLLVPPNQIAPEDADLVSKFSHRIPPEKATEISTFSSGLGLHFASSQSGRPPYILQGDIHIEMGALIGHDVGTSRLRVQDGELTEAYLCTSQGDPRGPPAPPRRIYILGKISSFKTRGT